MTARNREGGTRPVLWQEQAEAQSQKVKATSQDGAAQEWTQEARVDGWAIFGNPKRGARSQDRAARTGKRLQAGGDDIPAADAARQKRQEHLEATRNSQTNRTGSDGKGQRPENQFLHEISELKPQKARI
jgi:hypothetical protein